MKKFSLILILLLSFSHVFSQKEYTIEGQNYLLKTEVEGSWDLLWNVIDGNYRYFIRTEDGNIDELVNTKDSNGKFQNEFKSLLSRKSSNTANTDELKLTLPSLKNFFNAYNASQDSSYTYHDEKLKIKSRLGVFGGLTNNPFIDNPDDELSGLIGAELELYDDDLAKRHAAFFQFTHVLENDKLEYSTTELALGYRFRFINTKKFNIHANVKLVTLSFSNSTVYTIDEDTSEIISNEKSATSFDAPIIFGLGADFKVSDNGYITFYYNEIISLSLENQGSFPVNFALGYKFNL